MSRYVDLDGNTWDGKPIISKIQEVKTNHGYMSAITTGWLFSEGVPYLDIEKHDAKVRADAIEECISAIVNIPSKAIDKWQGFYASVINDFAVDRQNEIIDLLMLLKEQKDE